MAEEPRIVTYFRSMKKLRAATLHVKVGLPPMMRVGEDLRSTQATPLSDEEVRSIVYEILNDAQKKEFQAAGDLDFAYEIENRERFRVNVYRQRGRITVVARRVQTEIPTVESLTLPSAIEKVATSRQGLVLVTGTTGCGKSTTLAAMIGWINRNRRCSIVTIEDPIEYVYEDDKAVINQREINIDVPSFREALKHILRQDPDVIMIGELRDSESFQAGLSAAETGHLVFGTLHSANVAQTMSRILEFFPPDRETQIRRMLAFNMRAILSQKLLPSTNKEKGMVPAVEILLSTPTVRKLIQESRDRDLPEAIRADSETGMQDFNQSLADLVRRNLVDRKTAMSYSDNPEALQRELSGIVAKGGLVG
ncbi:MAG: PilT/PilU family type 4a pilus ATPase [Planctomycetota bacterium]